MKKSKNMNVSVKRIKNENKMKNVNVSIKKEILMLVLIIENQRVVSFSHLHN